MQDKNSNVTVIFLSEAQFLGTQTEHTSIQNFAAITGSSEMYVKAVLFHDLYVAPFLCCDRSYIHDFKRGAIGEDLFLFGIKKRLNHPRLSSEAVKKAWCSMCDFPHGLDQKLKGLASYLQQYPNVHLLIVSGTNPLQHEHNLEQLGQILPQDMHLPNLHFITSYEFETLNKQVLARKGIEHLTGTKKIPLENIRSIISLHRDMVSGDLLPPSFTRKCENIKTTSETDIFKMLKELIEPRKQKQL